MKYAQKHKPATYREEGEDDVVLLRAKRFRR